MDLVQVVSRRNVPSKSMSLKKQKRCTKRTSKQHWKLPKATRLLKRTSNRKFSQLKREGLWFWQKRR
jgi:hypothetical protein